MEYNNYLTLILVNVAAGHLLLASMVLKNQFQGDKKKPWTIPFTLIGSLSLIIGLHMIWTWPLPGSFNIAFGEPTVLFGMIMLGLAWACYRESTLTPLAIYALLGGLAAFIIGTRIINLGLSWSPYPIAIGFFFSGLSGILAWPFVQWYQYRKWRLMYGIITLVAALIWTIGALNVYWVNILEFASW